MVIGEIQPGWLYEWEPWRPEEDYNPRAYARVRVTKIWSYDDLMPFTEDDDDKPEANALIECEDLRTGRRYWNDLSRFREACTRIPDA